MKPKRKKRLSISGAILVFLLLALGTAAVAAYLNRPKPPDVPLSPPAPSPTVSPSPTPLVQKEELNPVAAVLEGFENVWAHSFEEFEALALKEENKAPMNAVRLALMLGNADILQPAQKLQALTKSGTDHWTGVSAERDPFPAFITGSGEIYTFGINVANIAPSDAQEQEDSTTPSPSPTPVPSPKPPVGRTLEGSCDVYKNKLEYNASMDGKLVCAVELIQTGSGYFAQIYRPAGAGKGVTRIHVQLGLISCALFPDMEQKDMVSLYDEAVSWEQLCQGADQVLTWTKGAAKLVIGSTVQSYR